MPPIRSVVFDVGETLMDDTTYWGSWADWLGVPRHTLAALVGAVTALGHDNAEALRLIRPGFDLAVDTPTSSPDAWYGDGRLGVASPSSTSAIFY